GDVYSTRWRVLALLGIAELFGMSLWFAASAVSPQLRSIWGLTPTEAGWLTTIVQLGFVCGTATIAVLNLADLVPPGRLFSACALLGAAVNASILAVPGYRLALLTRFLTGFFLAGVYPPAMKMISTWFRAERGLAIGVIVGALTVGKATPYLVRAIPHVGLRPVVLIASAGAVVGGLLVALGYREGPFPFTSRPFSWNHVGDVVRVREWRLATTSYLGHMFELYAFWTWIPAFLAASVAANAGAGFRASRMISLLAFTTIAIGGLGSVWGGIFADKRGRERLVSISLIVSGSCCLLSGFLFGKPLWVLGALAMTWGFFVIADSAQFSALVTESVPTHAVGTALTVQTSLGFLLTMLPMQLVPVIAQHAGWRWGFAVLALGPVAGITAIRELAAFRRLTPAGATWSLSRENS
ncbi:MAG TPA: MFS transporter, partial [Gemmatimonadaceae bacterium]|nr:MFS transporter [Gemmatimonadaceae bacterium]